MPVSKNRDILLDFVRGFAALLVCAGHLRAALFVDFSNADSASYLSKMFYFVTGFGHQSVMIFFVLSGYLVGGSILYKKEIFWGEYLSKRIIRLWVVLVPALVFTYLIDTYTRVLNENVLLGIYHSTINSGPSVNNPYSSTFVTFVSNLLFLQNVNMPIFGSNGPLWSLSNEFWYYLLFPLLLVILRKDYSNKAIYLTIIGLLFYWLPIHILEGFIVWMFGVIAFHINRKNYLNKKLAPIFFLMFGLALSMSRVSGGISNEWIEDIIIGGVFSLIISCQFKFGNINEVIKKGIQILSDISYTLYLFHFPLVILIYTMYFSEKQMKFSLETLCIYIMAMLGLLFISYLFWYLFERNTGKLQRIVSNYLNSNQKHSRLT